MTDNSNPVGTNEDWRLMGQEVWLAGRQLRRAEWFAHRAGWDHDHCAFCQAEIAASGREHATVAAGYVTADDNYTWICPEYFGDFKDRFRWTAPRERAKDESP